jgi:hypothetical protein
MRADEILRLVPPEFDAWRAKKAGRRLTPGFWSLDR